MTEEQKPIPEEEQPFIKHRGIWVPPSTLSPLSRLLRWTIPRFVGRIVPQSLRRKTSWDYLQLLIVPLFLAVGAFILQDQADQGQQRIADDRAKQETLNKYLDNMTALLFERKLRAAKPGSEARTVARARTLTVLRVLDGGRKGQLLRFLQEAKLVSGDKPVIDLSVADLRVADLRVADLSSANLRSANLRSANLSVADLRDASLFNVVLRGALFCKTTMPDGKENNRDCPRE